MSRTKVAGAWRVCEDCRVLEIEGTAPQANRLLKMRGKFGDVISQAIREIEAIRKNLELLLFRQERDAAHAVNAAGDRNTRNGQ